MFLPWRMKSATRARVAHRDTSPSFANEVAQIPSELPVCCMSAQQNLPSVGLYLYFLIKRGRRNSGSAFKCLSKSLLRVGVVQLSLPPKLSLIPSNQWIKEQGPAPLHLHFSKAPPEGLFNDITSLFWNLNKLVDIILIKGYVSNDLLHMFIYLFLPNGTTFLNN